MKQKTFRIPRNKKVTVSNLLGQDEINALLERVIKDKSTTEGIVVITQDVKGGISWRVSGFTPLEVIGLLEQVKAWECEDDGNYED
jgi:hypothetical protein